MALDDESGIGQESKLASAFFLWAFADVKKALLAKALYSLRVPRYLPILLCFHFSPFFLMIHDLKEMACTNNPSVL